MRHIYEIDSDRGKYWEVHTEHPKGVLDLIHVLQSEHEYHLYLDILMEAGVDFVIHTQEEYDEYHVALS
jgi:hypothetical protein